MTDSTVASEFRLLIFPACSMMRVKHRVARVPRRQSRLVHVLQCMKYKVHSDEEFRFIHEPRLTMRASQERAQINTYRYIPKLIGTSEQHRMQYKLAFHGVDTDTDILARIVARMSACRSACHRNNFRKSRVSDVSARILARMSVSVSAPWNSSLSCTEHRFLVV